MCYELAAAKFNLDSARPLVGVVVAAELVKSAPLAQLPARFNAPQNVSRRTLLQNHFDLEFSAFELRVESRFIGAADEEPSLWRLLPQAALSLLGSLAGVEG